MRHIVKQAVGVLALVLVLLGCGRQTTTVAPKSAANYKSAITAGIKAAEAGNVKQAQKEFEAALRAKAHDQKASAYLEQVKGYAKAQSELQAGKPATAMKTITAAMAIPGGAKAINDRLKDFKEEVAVAAKTHQNTVTQLAAAQKSYNAQAYAQASATLAPLLRINWDRHYYLKDLKPQITALNTKLQTAIAQASSQSAAAASSSAAAEATVTEETTTETADATQANQIRQNILAASQVFKAGALASVPDAAVLAAAAQGGGNYGTIGSILAQTYPDIATTTDGSRDRADTQ